jgi:hypothetical protein
MSGFFNGSLARALKTRNRPVSGGLGCVGLHKVLQENEAGCCPKQLEILARHASKLINTRIQPKD